MLDNQNGGHNLVSNIISSFPYSISYNANNVTNKPIWRPNDGEASLGRHGAAHHAAL